MKMSAPYRDEPRAREKRHVHPQDLAMDDLGVGARRGKLTNRRETRKLVVVEAFALPASK